jgi:V8-like Glu-specific endopeptidase
MANGTEEGMVPAEETEPSAEGNGNIQSPVRDLKLATAELWTTAEFEEAEPCDIIEISEEELEEFQRATQGKPEADAKGASIEEGGPPEVEAEADEEQAPAATAGGYNYPAPFTRHEVLCSYSIYPYRTIGKLFFEQGGGKYVCSAASIGNYAIWTAGHCVHAGNGQSSGWSTRVVFVPAYLDGKAPYGQWPASYLWTTTSWYKNGIPNGLCRDMGGAVLFPQNEKKISQVVGWLGFAWNWSRFQHWHELGYPAASPFNGQRMQEVEASYAYSDAGLKCDPKPVGTGSDLTGGSSGGPWIWMFGRGNYLNGNNSYRYSNKPQEMYSPYFDNGAKSLWDALVKSTP